MGKSNASQPAPVIVNPAASAGQQAQWNVDTAVQQRALNTMDQYTPQGSVAYSQRQDRDPDGNVILNDDGSAKISEIDGVPQMDVTQTYSPAQQNLYDTSVRLQQQYGDIGEEQLGKVSGALSNPFSLNAFGAAPAMNEGIRETTKQNILARAQPQQDIQRQALETSLANQGFQTGTEGWNRAMDESNRAQSDLLMGADAAAGNEMSRMYGLESAARDRAINEAIMERSRPMTELAAFMSGSQPTGPSFVPVPQGQIAAPDIMGAQYASANAQNSAAQNTYNQQMGSDRAITQGLFGLGAAGVGAAGYKWGRS